MTGQIEAHRDRMRTLATEFPRQLTQGYRIGRQVDGTIPRGVRRALVVGMGGSAIASDLLDSVLRPELGWELATVRGPTLPGTLPDPALVILVSYSGDTWESLAAYDSALARRAHCVSVSSGGELGRRAQRDGMPHASLPPGLPPRGALGLIFGALLGLLAPSLPQSYSRRLSAVVGRLGRRQSSFASRRGGPARLAARVGVRTPTILAGSLDLSIARRWQTEVEENSKRPAHVEQFPEVMHNALAAWEAMPRSQGRREAAIFLESVGEPGMVAANRTYLSRVLTGRGFRVGRVELPFKDRLEAVLTGVSFGDHFSLHLADQAGVDPFEIRALERAKSAVRSR